KPILPPGQLIAGKGFHLKILSNRPIGPAKSNDPSSGEQQEGNTDNRADWHLDKEKSGKTNENYGALAGEKPARQAIANEKGNGDGEDAKIVEEKVRRYHRRSDAKDRRLQRERNRPGPNNPNRQRKACGSDEVPAP